MNDTSTYNSPEIDKIAVALVKVQSEVGGVSKSGKNPHLRNSYATIGDVLDTVIPVAQAHGLVIIQRPMPSGNPNLILLQTLVVHESGQFLSSLIEMPLGKQDPQGYGSGMTYARRYGLMSFFGLKAEDDDGNAASGVTGPPAQASKPPTQATRPAAIPTGGVRPQTRQLPTR